VREEAEDVAGALTDVRLVLADLRAGRGGRR